VRATKERKILQDKHVEEMIMASVQQAANGAFAAALAGAGVKGTQPMLPKGAKSGPAVARSYADIPRPFTAPGSEGKPAPRRASTSAGTSAGVKSKPKVSSKTGKPGATKKTVRPGQTPTRTPTRTPGLTRLGACRDKRHDVDEAWAMTQMISNSDL
jgi:hypothetical protein